VVHTDSTRYGLLADWWRRRSAVGQRAVEDVLGWMIRAPSPLLTLGDITAGIKAPAETLRKVLRQLESQDLLERRDGGYLLTPAGQHEARRLVRSHRLWEAYLEHVGTPAKEIHPSAHELEHVYDEEAVDYLDDKLGHPILDPHGELIPEDFVHLVPGAEVKASLLRQGRGGTVVRVGPGIELTPGEQVTAKKREESGRIWVFGTASGREVKIDHHQADSVIVKLDESANSTPSLDPT
jgi:manganese/iron transport system permease protein/iron/zinc/copper transport system permease protein